MTQTEIKALKLLVLRCEALTDVKNTGCGVEPEHKEGVQLYVNSWITPILRELSKPPKERNGWWDKNLSDDLSAERHFKARTEQQQKSNADRKE